VREVLLHRHRSVSRRGQAGDRGRGSRTTGRVAGSQQGEQSQKSEGVDGKVSLSYFAAQLCFRLAPGTYGHSATGAVIVWIAFLTGSDLLRLA
jgi:hypothetical protein